MDVAGKIEATCVMQDAVGTAIAKGLPQDRIDAIGRGFAKIVGISDGEGAELVREARGELDFQRIIRKFKGGSDVPAVIRKTSNPANPYEDEDWSRINPDPALVGEEDKKMEPTNAQVLKAMQLCVAYEVAKRREENPRLNARQAQAQVFAEFPGLYPSLRKLAHGPERQLAKSSSSAEIEVATKSEEIKKAHPQLTDAQAYTRAIETTPGLMKRLLHDHSAVQADG